MKRATVKLGILLAAGIGLLGCAQQSDSDIRLDPDFGEAIRQDLMSQIADPDPHYLGTPAPGANGSRAALAQSRYQKNAVVQPSSVTASSNASVGNVDNGNGGAPPTAPSAGAALQ